MHRTQMTARERNWRSRLKKLLDTAEMVRGTLTVRRVTCGKKSCKCTRGERHVALYLTRTQKGKAEQLYIPRDLEPKAREWVREYQTAKELLVKISNEYWKRLRKHRR